MSEHIIHSGIPFAQEPARFDVNVRWRLDIFRRFIKEKESGSPTATAVRGAKMKLRIASSKMKYIESIIPSALGDRVLDIGDRGVMTERIERAFGGHVDNTLPRDFNFGVETPSRGYDSILCLEVIEHVMNPLNFILQLKDLLAPAGRIYLSTPKIGLLTVYQSPFHFTEYKPTRLEALFDYAGLKVARKKVFLAYPWWFVFWGLRPLFRVLFHRNILYELCKIE